MRHVTRTIAMAALLLVLAMSAPGKTFPVPAGESDDKTLSPFFFVQSHDTTLDQLPLKSTSVKVSISGVIADVQVTQVYRNEGKRPLEAIYVFPASTQAAVYGMKMTIGERTIIAKINKRDEARRLYEEARNSGKRASLLEQQRPNVFQMNVTNIMPGDEIKVELKYTELLAPTDRVYEFVYPAVVGPRYSNQRAETVPGREEWVQNPYLRQGNAPHYTFDMGVTITAAMPVKEVTSLTHKVETIYKGPAAVLVNLDKSEKLGGNHDYILRYRLDGEKIQSGLLLYRGPKENFFLLMMEPPKKVTSARIPGREYVFIVDVSGSMHGFPLEISKNLLKNLIGNLRPTDRFNVLLFSGGSSIMAEQSLPATPDNINRAIHLIERQQGGGGTELLPALKRALSLPKHDGYSRTVVIATDGYVTVEEEVFDLIRNNLGDANMFTFGIGTSVNRHILEGMARVGMGEPFVITRPNDAPAKAERFRTMIQSPVLTKVKVDFNGFEAYDVEPVSVPDVLAERPVIVFGKWRGTPRGSIKLSGISGDGRYSHTIGVGNVKPLKDNAALCYLWARHRIALLSDYNRLRSDDKRINEVTNLGLTYNLLTRYTSFVAIDTEVRNTEGGPIMVRQPLPLPQGVSDYAVGGMAPSQALSPYPFMAAGKATAAERKGKGIGNEYRKDEVERRTLTIEDIVVSGGLSKEGVRAVVEKYLVETGRCLEGNGLKGKFLITFTINGDGTVKKVKMVLSGLKNKSVEQCIAEDMKKLQFISTEDRQEATAVITLLLK